jgi:hypothetical protein
MLLVLTLSVLVGYSFTTARAAEKEVPPKVREGSTTAKPSDASDKSDSSDRKPAMREGEAGTPARQGDREFVKPSAERDGTRKPGTRDGEGEKKPGTRDGDKPRTGPRDGEGMKKTGERDGEGRKPSAERDGQKPRKGSERDAGTPARSSGEVITFKVIDGGDTILIGDEKIPANRLRGYLSTFLPEHPGTQVVIQAEANTEYKDLIRVLDAFSDKGKKNSSIKED